MERKLTASTLAMGAVLIALSGVPSPTLTIKTRPFRSLVGLIKFLAASNLRHPRATQDIRLTGIVMTDYLALPPLFTCESITSAQRNVLLDSFDDPINH